MPENIIIEALNWAWNQKEWMFDGIGNDLIGWVFVSLCATLLYFKNKFFSSKKQDVTSTILQPAFDLDNSTAKITRTPIIGNVPHGLVRATNGSRIEFTDSLIISNQNFVEFPLPTEIYSKNNSAELKITVKNLAIKLRKFDTDISSTQDSLFRNGNYSSAEYSDLSVQNNNHFNQYIREDSLKLMLKSLIV